MFTDILYGGRISKLNVALAYTSNKDIDNNGAHQQVKMTVDYRNIHATAPNQQIKTVVLQNGRRDNAVVNAKPDYQSAEPNELGTQQATHLQGRKRISQV